MKLHYIQGEKWQRPDYTAGNVYEGDAQAVSAVSGEIKWTECGSGGTAV